MGRTGHAPAGWIVVALVLLVPVTAVAAPAGRARVVARRHVTVAGTPARTLDVVAHREVAHDTSAPLRVMAPRHHVLPPAAMPAPIQTFDGISAATSQCNCAPADATGEAGTTQYVQAVNKSLQVFRKSDGASLLGPVKIATLWAGFGPGTCGNDPATAGDPTVLYDQFANRWIITQSALAGPYITEACMAVSTTSDATGSWFRYEFHIGTTNLQYLELKPAVWRDGYYMSALSYLESPNAPYEGPQPFAFDRAHMLTGAPATFLTTVHPMGQSQDQLLPADIDGPTLPPSGAPESFVQYPGQGNNHQYATYHFHADFVTPSNSTFSMFASPAAAQYGLVCPNTIKCVPQQGTTDRLDAVTNRLMFRLTYRVIGGHESVVGNYTVFGRGPTGGVRWFELRNVTSGPETVYQDSTYAPDAVTWRWVGSAAMDRIGDLAIGFSASSPSIYPQIRYAGRLGTDPVNLMTQGDAHLFDGTASQTGSGNRWGDYTDLTIDPVDNCTFWYTNAYYASGGSTQFNWRTRIGNFKFPTCGHLSIAKWPDAFGVTYGTPIGFTVTVVNDTNSAATGFAINDPLPGGTGVNWSVDTANSSTGWSVSGTAPNQSLVYTPTTLAAHTSTHVHVVSSTGAGSCKAYSNTASYSTTNLGNGSRGAFEIVSPVTEIVFAQNFDSTQVLSLPPGWSATQQANGSGAQPWIVTNGYPPPYPAADTPLNALASVDPGAVLDNLITSPSINVPNLATQLSFRSNYDMQNGFDGGVLEVSVDDGPFADVLAAGMSFVAGGYNGTISSSTGSPIAGRKAWTGSSGGFITTRLKLPASMQGHSIALRWRLGADASTAGVGWHVDTVQIDTGTTCGPAADMAVGIDGTPNPVHKGQMLTYNVPVVNQGPLAGKGVVVQVMLPQSTSFMSSSTTQGSCSGSGPVVTCSLGTVPKGTTPRITIKVIPLAMGPMQASASISTTVVDPNTMNNSSGTTTTVIT